MAVPIVAKGFWQIIRRGVSGGFNEITGAFFCRRPVAGTMTTTHFRVPRIGRTAALTQSHLQNQGYPPPNVAPQQPNGFAIDSSSCGRRFIGTTAIVQCNAV